MNTGDTTTLASSTRGEQSLVHSDWLRSWVQPQHLDARALERYRDGFSSHAARLVALDNFLVPQVANRLATFLRSEAEFAPEFGLYSREDAVDEREWLGAADSDRFFRLRKLVRTPPQFQMSPNALTYLQFRRAFQRPELKEFFEAISGLPLGWSDDFGAHSMVQGDFLRPHSDDNRNRRLALVIYLSPEWKPEFGGTLQVVDRRGTITDIEPRHNRLIVFDVLAAPAHLVLPILGAAGQHQRLTIGGWYHGAA